MFFDDERIFNLRKMILSETVEDRVKYLDLLIPYQKASSLEKPKVICVKSFVPNEKNSASLAISSAVNAALGTSLFEN